MNWKWQLKNSGLFVLFVFGVHMMIDFSGIPEAIGAVMAWIAIQNAEPPKL